MVPLNAPVVPLIAPAVRELEPRLIAPKPLPMLPPVNAPTEVIAGCAAVVTVPAVVAVDALPDRAPAKVVALTVPPLDELVPLLKFVAVVAVDALPVTFPVNAPTKVVAPSEPVEGFHVSFE